MVLAVIHKPTASFSLRYGIASYGLTPPRDQSALFARREIKSGGVSTSDVETGRGAPLPAGFK